MARLKPRVGLTVGPLALVIALLAGCANGSLSERPPAVPGQVQTQEAQPTAAGAGGVAAGDAAKESSIVVDDIYQSARNAMEQLQWQRAIELAEHGLRLDRRQARLYWVLAESYWALGRGALATGFAKQGLLYLAPGEGELERRLQDFTN